MTATKTVRAVPILSSIKRLSYVANILFVIILT